MHLINPLVAGIGGAANGTAELYKRGTSTRAPYYTDFEGTGLVSSGADVVLDSNGGATVYVNDLVHVLVKDSTGLVVRDFTAGDASPAIEVRSSSFTGTDYTSATRAAGNPTTLQTVLDLVKTSFGTTDFNVGATPVTMSAFYQAVSGMFVNVKDPAYGAKGDAATDDTAAINAAFAYANAHGGIVFFPTGIYRVVSAITWTENTSVMGVGADSTWLAIDHATNNMFAITGSGATTRRMSGLKLIALQANSGTLLPIGNACSIVFRECDIGSVSVNNGDLVTATSDSSTIFRFEDCNFNIGGGSKGIFNGAGALESGKFINCRFANNATAYSPSNGMIYGRNLELRGCRFVNNATSGTYSCFKSNSTTVDARVVNCTFGSTGGATATAMELGTYASGAVFYESGNFFGSSGVTAYSYTCAAASKGANVQLVTRQFRRTEVATDATPYNPPIDQYGIVVIKRSTNTAQALTATAPPPDGATGTLILWNAIGGSTTYTGANTTLSLPIYGTTPPNISDTATVETPYVVRITTNLRVMLLNALSSGYTPGGS